MDISDQIIGDHDFRLAKSIVQMALMMRKALAFMKQKGQALSPALEREVLSLIYAEAGCGLCDAECRTKV